MFNSSNLYANPLPFPIAKGGVGGALVPRISVVHEDLNPDIDNSGAEILYMSKTETSVTFSWEMIEFWDTGGIVNGQVTLYIDGRVTMCWGNGIIPDSDSLAAGLEDDNLGYAFPAVIFDGKGTPTNIFDSEGITDEYPANKCACYYPACDEVGSFAPSTSPKPSAQPSAEPSSKPTGAPTPSPSKTRTLKTYQHF